MKKTLITLLILTLTLTLTLPALAEDTPIVHYAITQPGAEIAPTQTPSGATVPGIGVSIVGYGLVYTLILPEGAPDIETLPGKGIRLTFDAPVDDLLATGDAILTPAAVEIIGTQRYGRIADIGEDFLLHAAFAEDGITLQDPERFTITPDTQQHYGVPFQAGSGCEMIVDDDGVVVVMVEANG